MKFRSVFASATVALALSAPTPGHAVVVTSIPGGTVIPIPEVNLTTVGPESPAPGVTWTGSATSLYGFTGSYDFLTNGLWYGGNGPPMVGTNSPGGGMEFTFATPVSAVGGLLNWAHPTTATASIEIYDASNQLLDSLILYSLDLGISATPNSFYGFSVSSAIIARFLIGGDYISLRNLTVSSDIIATPLPGALPLFATGLGIVGFAGWRRKRKAALAAA